MNAKYSSNENELAILRTEIRPLDHSQTRSTHFIQNERIFSDSLHWLEQKTTEWHAFGLGILTAFLK